MLQFLHANPAFIRPRTINNHTMTPLTSWPISEWLLVSTLPTNIRNQWSPNMLRSFSGERWQEAPTRWKRYIIPEHCGFSNWSFQTQPVTSTCHPLRESLRAIINHPCKQDETWSTCASHIAHHPSPLVMSNMIYNYDWQSLALSPQPSPEVQLRASSQTGTHFIQLLLVLRPLIGQYHYHWWISSLMIAIIFHHRSTSFFATM